MLANLTLAQNDPFMSNFMIAVIVINELIGPLFFKRAITRSGESGGAIVEASVEDVDVSNTDILDADILDAGIPDADISSADAEQATP